jgi:hypothetical protein
MRRLLLALIAVALAGAVSVPVASARRAAMSKAPNLVLDAPRGYLAPGDTVKLTSEDLRWERKGALVQCPVSVLTGSVVTNTASEVTVSLTEASFGGGLNEACDFLIPPGEIGYQVRATGLPWTMKVLPKGLNVAIESPSGTLIERPGVNAAMPCIYSSRRFLLRSPGSVNGASVFEMSSWDARLKISNGCGVRPKAASMSADWTLSSEGEPVHLELVYS